MDEQSFLKLYQAHAQVMYYIAHGILGDVHLAEDVVQEAFIKVLENPGAISHRDDRKTGAFLYTISRNLAINLYHKNKKLVSFDPAEGDHLFSATGPSAEAAYFDAHPMEEAIRKCPLLYRDVLLMHDVYEISYADIAFYLGLKESTVRKRLERARAMMRKILEEEGAREGF